MMHIKLNGITKYSNMLANILPADPLPDLRAKGQFFQNMVMLHIKLNELMKYNNMVANILPTNPHLLYLWVKRSKQTFSEHAHVEYQIYWIHKCSNKVANILPAAPHNLTIGFKRSKFNFFQNNAMLHIKLKGITNAATW